MNPSPLSLRYYQTDTVEAVRASLRSKHRRPVVHLPTGAGKTVIASAIGQSIASKGNHCIFFAPRRELIGQAAAKFEAIGAGAGIIMAGVKPDLSKAIQVASFDTFLSRVIHRKTMELPPADVLIVDEAHLSITPSRIAILDRYPKAVVVGLTATPARGDGRGLGEVYDHLIPGPSVAQLVDDGFLVPLEYVAPSTPDLKGVGLDASGDYREKDLAERMNGTVLFGDVVQTWKKHAAGMSTVAFCVNISHSKKVCKAFNAAGIKAEHVDESTPSRQREAIFDRVRSGHTKVLCNVFLASYGLDIPRLACAILLRPTRSLTMYLQMIGRIMRPWEGKRFGKVIDHSGSVEENGFADDVFPWSLDSAKTVREREDSLGESKPHKCPECQTVFHGRECPKCGWEDPTRAILTMAADLAGIDRVLPPAEVEARRNYYATAMAYAESRHYKTGWAAHSFRTHFGAWPDASLRDVAPSLASNDALRIIRAQLRNYAQASNPSAAFL